MFRDWSEFYLLAGSAAAVLIGLVFVVVTLMQDRPRSSVLQGSKLYMGPVVLHMSFVLALSAAALVPGVSARQFAVITWIIALWGLARGIYSVVGLARLWGSGENEVHWTDMWFYGVIPSALYVAMGVVALAFWNGAAWASDGIAAVIAGLVLLSIRDEYDLVTWLAPRRDSES
jgi:hypothetical protein